jgi:hypothetical protein
MRKIDISINQAKLLSFDISFNEEELPDVTATIALLSGNKQISTFSLSTKSWQDKVFELPITMIQPIKDIAKDLEVILIRECSASLGQLKSGK